MSQLPILELPDEQIDNLYSFGELWLANPTQDQNQYLIAKSDSDPKKGALVKMQGEFLVRVKKNESLGIIPRDAQQTAFVDSLVDPKVLVSVGVGRAGTGKSSLAIAYALDELLKNKKKIILTKPAVYVGQGKAFGAVPGDVQEKMAPFIGSFQTVLNKHLGGNSKGFLEQLIKREQLQFLPLEFTRGCTFEDTTVILDEAQNTYWHEFNSFCTRIGEGSKLIVLGDTHQVDIKCPKQDTGLAKFISSKAFAKSAIGSLVVLTQQYRSPITALVNSVDEEFEKES